MSSRPTRRVASAEARQRFSELVSQVRRDERPVIIEKGGVPVVAMVPLSVLEREERWSEERAERIAVLERLRRPFRSVPSEEIERQALAAVAEDRRERARSRRTRR